MKNKLLSLALSIIMILSLVSFPAFSEGENAITVYITLSDSGKFITAEDGTVIANIPLELTGKESYTLDDAFRLAHDLYYPGDEGYSSSESEFDGIVSLGIDKFWGDTTFKYGYQVNNGSETVMDAAHPLSDGDYIDGYLNESYYPHNEYYSCFNERTANIYTNEELEITLSASYYNSSFELVSDVVTDAAITVNGEETDIITDENGKAILSFEEAGEYLISAIKTKTLPDETAQVVTAITAPTMRITVTENPALTAISNIIEKYSQSGVASDGNMLWFLSDFGAYETLSSENVLSEAQIEECLNKIIDSAKTTSSPGDLAKTIIALRSMGYDPESITTFDRESINLVSRLTALIDEQSADVTGNVYGLSYVIIALQSYATQTQIDYLINAAISSKATWQNTEWGTDAAAPMLLALAPYSETKPEVKTILDETVEIIKELQEESGLINNAASTGLVIAGFSALGIDASTVKNGENSLIDGLMSLAFENLDGFYPDTNSFSTEQGLRGLLAWKLYKEENKSIYDFSANDKKETRTYVSENCPVEFVLTPADGTLTVSNATEVLKNKFDLSAGNYTYTLTKDGYYPLSGDFEITEDDVTNHTHKTITATTYAVSTGGGGGGGGSRPKDETPKEPEKEEKPSENEKVEETDKPTEDTEKRIFSASVFNDVKEEDWYYNSVKYVYENNLFNGIGEGFAPNSNMTRAMLVTVLYRLENTDFEGKSEFIDIPENEWYSNAVSWAKENGIVSGITDSEFAPDANITREQIAVIIYRYANFKGLNKGEKAELSEYADASEISDWATDALSWANSSQLINGMGDNTLSPKSSATRAQVAAIFERYAGNIK